MAVVASDQELRAHERHFTRTLFFARIFLSMIRSKPEFARSRKADYASEPIEQELYLGDPLQVRFQAFGGPSNEKQSIVAGKEDTLRDLHDRLCRLTGFTKLRLIVGGQMLSTDNSGDKKLEDIPGIDWILVSKAAGAEPLKPETDSITNRSIFETTILSHFEDMYSCMDSDDHISEAVCSD
jgi:ubiquitin carboxyl-terminal hydrolase 34